MSGKQLKYNISFIIFLVKEPRDNSIGISILRTLFNVMYKYFVLESRNEFRIFLSEKN